MNLISLKGLLSEPSYLSNSSGFFKARMVLAIFSKFDSAFLGAQASGLSAPVSSSKTRADCLMLKFELTILIFLFVICLLFYLFDLCLRSDRAYSNLFSWVFVV